MPASQPAGLVTGSGPQECHKINNYAVTFITIGGKQAAYKNTAMRKKNHESYKNWATHSYNEGRNRCWL